MHCGKLQEMEVFSWVSFYIPRHTNGELKKKEEISMADKANKCIECTVQQCAHHCEGENYCSLDRILVGTHELNPTVDQCTDCKSFHKK